MFFRQKAFSNDEDFGGVRVPGIYLEKFRRIVPVCVERIDENNELSERRW